MRSPIWLSLCHHYSGSSLSAESRDDITRLLHDWSHGDAAALPLLVEAVYPELRRIASRQFSGERQGHTLQPTALVTYIRRHLGGDSARP